MGGFSISWGGRPQSVERDSSGNYFYKLFDSNTSFKVLSDQDKLKAVLSNPAALKVIALNCDLFSLGNINSYSEGKIKQENILYDLRKKPNFKQSWTQFLWDYKFWLQFGTAYLWNPGGAKVLSDANPIQWLNPVNIDWQPSTLAKLRSLIFSNTTLKDVLKGSIRYNNGNGEYIMIPLSDITPFFDLSNGINPDGNFYKGASRLDALYKVIANSEAAMDAKNINLVYSGKFMVSGKQDPENTTQLPMTEEEKVSVEQQLNSKKVHAVKSQIDIHRFVDNVKNLVLDDSFMADYFIIGSMLNTPKDILESDLKSGSTYENQEKATMRHIEYGMKPGGQMFTDHLEGQYGLTDIRMSWDHLSCNQFAELDRANKVKVQLDNIKVAKELGLDEAKAKELIDNITLI